MIRLSGYFQWIKDTAGKPCFIARFVCWPCAITRSRKQLDTFLYCGCFREIYHTKRMQRVTSIRYSRDDRYIISGSDEMNIRIWKAQASEKLGYVSVTWHILAVVSPIDDGYSTMSRMLLFQRRICIKATQRDVWWRTVRTISDGWFYGVSFHLFSIILSEGSLFPS